ncbi:MAG TPA: urea amidolyase family protein [Acidimicrobiales bacterium]|nr:urea amidolyase family protein [Acidimicrobiales bacterium]
MNFLAFGGDAFLIEVEPGQAQVLWRALRQAALPGVEELVPATRSILIRLRPGTLPHRGPPEGAVPVTNWDQVRRRIEALGAGLDSSMGPSEVAPVVMQVVYDGEDLAEVARLSGLSVGEVVRRHVASTWTVSFLGFSPGFAYLEGDDPTLAVPRRAAPRARVPAGSVALAAGMCAVYPQTTPGGWQLIGRTGAVLFDPKRRPPSLLAPGDRVRFDAVRDEAGAAAPASPAGTRSPEAPGVEVVDPGPLTTVQDLGRIGWAHLGVPRSGAVDRGSLVRANRLVGNPDGAAGLEATAAGPRLRFRVATTLAVTGAVGPILVDGRPVQHSAAVPVPAGAEVHLAAFERGWRAYVALAGGVDAEVVLGSRSTDTLSGLGPPALAAGAGFDLGPAGLPTGWSPTGGWPAEGSPAGPWGLATGPADLPLGAQPALPNRNGAVEVGLAPGPRVDWIGDEGLDRMAERSWTVSTTSDRTGMRLDGPGIAWVRPGGPHSEGMVAGAVQVPPAGLPIVLLANHATTGGYPAVAVVEPSGLEVLAQCPPGTVIRFRLVST